MSKEQREILRCAPFAKDLGASRMTARFDDGELAAALRFGTAEPPEAGSRLACGRQVLRVNCAVAQFTRGLETVRATLVFLRSR
jgi:hypothetical protein